MSRTAPVATLSLLLAALAFTLVLRPGADLSAAADAEAAALERTRKQVRMLDDLYKTAVVLITDKYVHDEDDFPAGGAAVALFAAMKKKGWHEVRLLDATGQPIRSKNAPKDDFEKAGIAAVLEGKTWHETVETREGQRYLRVATPVPVVSEKCVICHEHYKEAKPGAAIGALGYTLKVE